MSCSNERQFTFQPVEINPGAGRKVKLNLFDKCANFWQPNSHYSLGEFIFVPYARRDSRELDRTYECTVAGRTGMRAIRFPTTVGQTVESGTAQFTCRVWGLTGILPILSPVAVSDPTGIEISDVSVVDNCKIVATYNAVGATLGQDYDAVFTFMLNGVQRVVRQTVKVRKQ